MHPGYAALFFVAVSVGVAFLLWHVRWVCRRCSARRARQRHQQEFSAALAGALPPAPPLPPCTVAPGPACMSVPRPSLARPCTQVLPPPPHPTRGCAGLLALAAVQAWSRTQGAGGCDAEARGAPQSAIDRIPIVIFLVSRGGGGECTRAGARQHLAAPRTVLCTMCPPPPQAEPRKHKLSAVLHFASRAAWWFGWFRTTARSSAKRWAQRFFWGGGCMSAVLPSVMPRAQRDAARPACCSSGQVRAPCWWHALQAAEGGPDAASDCGPGAKAAPEGGKQLPPHSPRAAAREPAADVSASHCCDCSQGGRACQQQGEDVTVTIAASSASDDGGASPPACCPLGENEGSRRGECCAICMCVYAPGDRLRQLPCSGGHRYHQACIDPW